jgi:hypothetical protein
VVVAGGVGAAGGGAETVAAPEPLTGSEVGFDEPSGACPRFVVCFRSVGCLRLGWGWVQADRRRCLQRVECPLWHEPWCARTEWQAAVRLVAPASVAQHGIRTNASPHAKANRFRLGQLQATLANVVTVSEDRQIPSARQCRWTNV